MAREDLRRLFGEMFDREYAESEYEEQFSIRVDRYMEKVTRMEDIFKDEPDMPEEFWHSHNRQKEELEARRAETGKSVLPPQLLPNKIVYYRQLVYL